MSKGIILCYILIRKKGSDMMSINTKCRVLQGTYCALLCIALSFNTYYLEETGFSDRVIGIFIASSCTLGSILQFAAGRLADTKEKYNWKNQLAVLAAAQTLVSALLYFTDSRFMTSILYMLMMMLVLPMMPLINRSGFYYTERGIPVDFGVARGIGSLTFALMSFTAGRFTVLWGSRVVPLLAFASVILFMITTLSMPMMDGESGTRDKASESTPLKELTGKYPVFFRSVIGIFLMLLFHNGINTYMIKIVSYAGGGSGSMGAALGIAAFAEIPLMFLYSRMTKGRKVRDINMVSLSGAIFVLRGIFYLLASNVYVVFAIQLLQGISFGILIAAKANYANESMEAEDQSSGQSLVALTESFGTIMGGLLGGFLLDRGGVPAMLIVFTLAAAAGTLITILSGRASEKADKK